MSEPSEAEVAKQEDMRLDAQIDDHVEEKHRERMEDLMAIPDDSEPEREPPPSDWCRFWLGEGSCPKCGGFRI